MGEMGEALKTEQNCFTLLTYGPFPIRAVDFAGAAGGALGLVDRGTIFIHEAQRGRGLVGEPRASSGLGLTKAQTVVVGNGLVGLDKPPLRERYLNHFVSKSEP